MTSTRHDDRPHKISDGSEVALDATPDSKLEALKLFAQLGRRDAYGTAYFDQVRNRWSYAKRNEPLDEAVLLDHLDGRRFAGMFIYSPGSDRTSILTFDLDDHQHDLGGAGVRAAALRLRDAAVRHGLRLWGVRSGGGSGIHLSARWEEPQPGGAVRELAAQVLGEIGFADGSDGVINSQIEMFPKQDGVAERDFGSLVALPFGRESVPLDNEMQPAEEPLPWAASEPVPEVVAKAKPKRKRDKQRTWSPADIERLRSALMFLVADDYALWVRCGIALKHDLGEAGWSIWNSWSARSDKYPGEEEARKKWDSFDRSERDNPITAASIFYDAEAAGWVDPEAPLPMGYTDANTFVVYDPGRRSIISYSPEQLAKASQLAALAGPYWQRRFPAESGFGFNPLAVAQWLIARCRKAGPFSEGTVRGRGVWRDGDEIVVNVEREPTGAHLLHRYICFDPIRLPIDGEFDTERLLRLLQRFQWYDPNYAMLVLGWMATTPICGMLGWRVHVWPYGPAECGKTTLTEVLSVGCAPMVLSALGGSTAAGIRQRVQRDARGVVLDDMDREDDGGQRQIREVLRLMRLASSADQTLLRGTADHTGQEFQIACSFAITGINPCGMEAADESRTVLLKMLPHNNRPETRRIIRDELYGCAPSVADCAE